jgi:diacylglycerol kinase (ATP)
LNVTIAKLSGLAVSVFAIINPISGAGADARAAERRVEMLRSAAKHRGLTIECRLTARGGHARELAREAAAAGASLVVAWGGDGTINEVGCELLNTSIPLAVVPAGSGNGLAAALALPWRPEAAIAAAFDGRDRNIDAGSIGGRPFFNVAGIGFDAHIARLFGERPKGRRGGLPYVTLSVGEGCRYSASEYTLSLDGQSRRVRALLIAFANGREFGMRTRIAPQAQLDDGLLDAVVIEDRSVTARFLGVPYLAFAAVHRLRGVTVTSIREAVVELDGPIEYHVDGEPDTADGRVEVSIMPGALRVRIPNP